MTDTNNQPPPERPLGGWREIAAHFGRDQSTVKRWAASNGLPVYRVGRDTGKRGVPVHAYPSELDAWLRAHRRDANGADTDRDAPGPLPEAAQDSPARKSSLWPRARVAAALAGATVLIGLVAVPMWQLGGTSPPTLPLASAVTEEARELYLRGTYLWNRRSPEGIAGAIEALGQAIAIHPDYAEAHAGLAMTYNLARQYGGMSGFDAYPLAEKHARRAVELDPTSGFAQSVLAFVEFHWLWQVEAGLARFEEALRLDPDSANTLQWYASSLNLAGRPADALPIVMRAQQIEPASSAVLNMKAAILFHNGQEDEALELLEDIRQRDPGFAWAYYLLYSIDAARGDHASYLENYATLGELTGLPRYRVVAEAGEAALAEGGVEAMGRAMIAAEGLYYERGEATAWDLARHHALIGDAEGALHWLGISHERHEERLIGLLVDTAFWPIRGSSEFKRLVADIGLPLRT